jgi:copper chaperone CopZ
VEKTTTKQIYRIAVQGMDCRSCEQLLVKQVTRVPGVDTASADATAGTLTILADSNVSAEGVSRAIVAAGFVPVGLDGGNPPVPVVDLLPAEREKLMAAPEC